MRLLALACALALSGCEFANGLNKLDLANQLFDSSCGSYTFHDQQNQERCGAMWDSTGLVYTPPHSQIEIARLLLGHNAKEDTDPVLDYLPDTEIWFDLRYLKAGQTLGPEQALASCSRFKIEDPEQAETYANEMTQDFSLKILENLGGRSDEQLQKLSRWRVAWEIHCPTLEMDAQGQDQIDFSLNPSRERWQNLDNTLPPEALDPTGHTVP